MQGTRMIFILLDIIVLHHHVEHDMSFKKTATEMSMKCPDYLF